MATLAFVLFSRYFLPTVEVVGVIQATASPGWVLAARASSASIGPQTPPGGFGSLLGVWLRPPTQNTPHSTSDSYLSQYTKIILSVGLIMCVSHVPLTTLWHQFREMILKATVYNLRRTVRYP